MRMLIAILLGLALFGQSHVAVAGADSNDSTPQQVGYGAGSVLGTLVYSPIKASFCILGGVASGFTAIASPPTAGKVARASCGGTW
ncbi:MAG: hypothetical protein HY216_03400, partial [Candidatus Rokubacteria bacterium]|nr:hypothetical protein [Candidatus Rokubacteria bacterium]